MWSMIGIISDIHGNLPALQAVLAALTTLGADRLICAGDVAGYYPFINECCQRLREAKALVVQGNHDFYLATGTPCPRSRSANDCLAYQARVITPENRAWLGSLARPAGWKTWKLSTAAGAIPWTNIWFRTKPISAPWKAGCSYPATAMSRLCGRGKARSGATPVRWASPGTATRAPPLPPLTAAFTLHRVAYPVAQTMAAMTRAGFNDYYFRNLAHGLRIGATRTRRARAAPPRSTADEAVHCRHPVPLGRLYRGILPPRPCRGRGPGRRRPRNRPGQRRLARQQPGCRRCPGPATRACRGRSFAQFRPPQGHDDRPGPGPGRVRLPARRGPRRGTGMAGAFCRPMRSEGCDVVYGVQQQRKGSSPNAGAGPCSTPCSARSPASIFPATSPRPGS